MMDALARNMESSQFQLRQLFYAMTAIALALSIAKLLGNPFGWITLCPFAVIFIQVCLASKKLLYAVGIGFVVGSICGGLVVDWPFGIANFYKACFSLGMFGASTASAIYLIWLDRKILGVTTLVTSSAILLYVIFATIPVP